MAKQFLDCRLRVTLGGSPFEELDGDVVAWWEFEIGVIEDELMRSRSRRSRPTSFLQSGSRSLWLSGRSR
jgi:hypothetical protein